MHRIPAPVTANPRNRWSCQNAHTEIDFPHCTTLALARYNVGMSEPTPEQLKARIAELEQKLTSRKSRNLEFRVSEKGWVSVYGLGRFPVTLYYEQWMRLLGTVDELRAFIEENKSRLKTKDAE